eukprot:gene16509-biopygen3785
MRACNVRAAQLPFVAWDCSLAPIVAGFGNPPGCFQIVADFDARWTPPAPVRGRLSLLGSPGRGLAHNPRNPQVVEDVATAARLQKEKGPAGVLRLGLRQRAHVDPQHHLGDEQNRR